MTRSSTKTKLKIRVAAEDMGYGHLRAAHPFREFAKDGILSIGESRCAAPGVRRQWARAQRLYEFISRKKDFPVIGKYLFGLMNRLLEIPPYYPIRDRSAPTLQVKILEHYLEAGLYERLIEKAAGDTIPFLTTFYAPAIAAERAGMKNVFCVITDTDANRVWVTRDPRKSRIKYLVPSPVARGRLMQYGVRGKDIFLTGFPLSDTLLGGKDHHTLEDALAQRLHNLDPDGAFGKHFAKSVKRELGIDYRKVKSKRPLTITFTVGGAGAQKETAAKIMTGLKTKLARGDAALNLVAGTRKEVRNYFLGLVEKQKAKNIRIIFAETKEEYFELFDRAILETDILWTKPSELSFYAALGLPVIMSPSIGAQEDSNRRWLRDDIGAGIVQREPECCAQWIDDYLKSGRFAEAAWLGYLKIEKTPAKEIVELIYGISEK